MKLKEGMLIRLTDEKGVYELTGYDKALKQWNFKEYCICGHSCYGGMTGTGKITIYKTKGKR